MALCRNSFHQHEHSVLEPTKYRTDKKKKKPKKNKKKPKKHRNNSDVHLPRHFYAETLHVSVAVKSNTRARQSQAPINPISTTNNSKCFVMCVRGNGSGVSSLSFNKERSLRKPYPIHNTYSVGRTTKANLFPSTPVTIHKNHCWTFCKSRKRRTGSSTRRFQVLSRLAQAQGDSRSLHSIAGANKWEWDSLSHLNYMSA